MDPAREKGKYAIFPYLTWLVFTFTHTESVPTSYGNCVSKHTPISSFRLPFSIFHPGIVSYSFASLRYDLARVLDDLCGRATPLLLATVSYQRLKMVFLEQSQ